MTPYWYVQVRFFGRRFAWTSSQVPRLYSPSSSGFSWNFATLVTTSRIVRVSGLGAGDGAGACANAGAARMTARLKAMGLKSFLLLDDGADAELVDAGRNVADQDVPAFAGSDRAVPLEGLIA